MLRILEKAMAPWCSPAPRLTFASPLRAGDVTGDVVYANYGRTEDFDELARLGVNVSGAIVIARYGEIFRGDKVGTRSLAWNTWQRLITVLIDCAPPCPHHPKPIWGFKKADTDPLAKGRWILSILST